MENSNFNQGGQRYDAIKHIDYLIDMIKDASSVPFSDKCSIERTETVNSLQILKNNLPGAVAQSNDIVSRAQDRGDWLLIGLSSAIAFPFKLGQGPTLCGLKGKTLRH